METAARCGCARDAHTANPACDTPDGITLSWNGREGCGVLVIGYLYDLSTLLVPTDRRSTGQLVAEGINLLTYYLQPSPTHHRLIVLVPPYVYTRPRLTRHHSRAAPGIPRRAVAGSLKPGTRRLVSYRCRGL